MNMRGRSDWSGGVAYPAVDGISDASRRVRKHEDGSWGAASSPPAPVVTGAVIAPGALVLLGTGADGSPETIINCEAPKLPLLWWVTLVVRFAGAAWASEVNPFVFSLWITLGNGRGAATFPVQRTLTGAGAFDQTLVMSADQPLPARRLQAGASLSGTPTVVNSEYNARFFLTAAPYTLIGEDTA